MLDKKAQIGETMTWVVATIIIIVILVIAIVVVSSSPFKGGKKIESKNTKTDLLVTKSFLGYLLRKDSSGARVFEQLKDKKTYLDDPVNGGELEKSNIDLAKKIFPVLYKEEYSERFFLGINSEWCGWDKYNQTSSGACDRSRPFEGIDRKSLTTSYVRISYDRIKLKDRGNKDDNTILELILNKPTKIS